MNFYEALEGYIGRTVEVFLANQVYIGELQEVEECYFTLQTSDTYYYGPSMTVTVIADSVQFVRVLAA